MDPILSWKVVLDGMLLISLAALCYQLFRLTPAEGRTERIGQLERALRGLVQEAEASSRSLGEQLSKRQQALEQLLFDIGLIETRVNRLITGAEEKKRELDQQLARLSQSLKFAEERSPGFSRFETGANPRLSADQISSEDSGSRLAVEVSLQNHPEATQPKITRHAAAQRPEEFIQSGNYPANSRVEPDSQPVPRALLRSGLDSQVESEVLEDARHDAPIFERERLPGKSSAVQDSGINEFVEQARRKIDEAAASARNLGQASSSERHEALESAADVMVEDLEQRIAARQRDPRLGVLAKMKRETRFI